MNNFLLIEHGGKFKDFTFQIAIKKGLKLFLATSTPEDWMYDYIDKEDIIIVDTNNVTELIVFVESFMFKRKISFVGVGTFFEHFVTQAAELSEVLGLTGTPISAIYSSSRNKLVMRNKCVLAGIPQPKYDVIEINEINKIKKFIEENGSLILKPIYGGSSVGVVKINKDSDLENLISNLSVEMKNEPDNVFKDYSKYFLIEEYMEGKVISVDGLIQNKKIFFIGETEFFLGKEPKFIQEGGITPTNFNQEEISVAKEMVTNIIKALELDYCGFHCELRMTKDGPRLIEIAARLPGGPIQSNYKTAYGIDSTDLMYDIWLGKDINITKVKNKFLMHKDVYTKNIGKVKNIKINNSVNNLSEIVEFLIFAKEGQEVTSDGSYPNVLYYYSIVCDSLEDLYLKSDLIENSVNFEIE